MFKFLKDRPLWVHLLIGLFLAIIIFLIFLLSLRWMTHHGRSKSVPSVIGKSYDEARKTLSSAGFEVEIQDSIYVDTLKPMTIIRQIPDADEIVKSNRTVFLVINRSIPPLVEMPNLVGYSFRNAEMVLKNMDLRIGDTLYKPDFAKNSVLEQIYHGSIIPPGTRIRKGSVISLVLGDGVGNREFTVPSLVGLTYEKAKRMLEEAGLGIGVVVPNANVKDTLAAFIYKQNPPRFDEDKQLQHIRTGQLMDVWLQVDKPIRDTTEIPKP